MVFTKAQQDEIIATYDELNCKKRITQINYQINAHIDNLGNKFETSHDTFKKYLLQHVNKSTLNVNMLIQC